MPTTYTPGPWQIEGDGDQFVIANDEGFLIATCPYNDDAPGVEPLDTADGMNAALISAAPELLEALENIHAELQGIAELGNSITDNAPHWPMQQIQNTGQVVRLEAERAQEIARAAIAKAKGVK